MASFGNFFEGIKSFKSFVTIETATSVVRLDHDARSQVLALLQPLEVWGLSSLFLKKKKKKKMEKRLLCVLFR